MMKLGWHSVRRIQRLRLDLMRYPCSGKGQLCFVPQEPSGSES